IVENDKHVAVHLRRLGLIDDHDTIKSAALLLAGKWQNQRVVPEEPAVRRRKTIIERTAGRHRLLRQAAGAIQAIDDPHAMPVEACWLIELVDEPNFDFLAFLVTQERSRHFAIITPDGGLDGGLGQELQTALPRFEDTKTVL